MAGGGYDGQDWNGTWSAWQTFTVDTTRPGAPYVSSTDYPQDGAWHGSGGKAGKFTFTPASGTNGLAGYVYSLDGAAAATVAATGASTVSLTPAADGHRTLRVQTKDKAGNVSTPVAYDFLVGQGAMVRPAEGAVERTARADRGRRAGPSTPASPTSGGVVRARRSTTCRWPT